MSPSGESRWRAEGVEGDDWSGKMLVRLTSTGTFSLLASWSTDLGAAVVVSASFLLFLLRVSMLLVATSCCFLFSLVWILLLLLTGCAAAVDVELGVGRGGGSLW